MEERYSKFHNIYNDPKRVIQSKEYGFQISEDTYTLRIDVYFDQTMYFFLK